MNWRDDWLTLLRDKRTRLAGVLVSALLLSGCSPGAAEPGELVLKVGDQKGNSQSLLSAAGLLKDLPYKLEWSTFTSGPPLLEAASASAIDLGGVGNTPPIFAAAANAKITVVAAAQGDASSDAILVPDGSPLTDAGSLRGKQIAVAKGSSAHGSLLLVLQRAGLRLSDVKPVFLAPAEAYAAFTQKRVDAWAVWDPYTSQALLEAKARVLVDGAGVANGYSFQVASRSALTDSRKTGAIKDYLSRLAKAQRWSDAHRPERAKTWAEETGLSLPVATAAVERGVDLYVPLDAGVIRSEQELADAFTTAKVLPGKVNFAEFVDTRFDADIQTALK
ncbi:MULTISPECIES: ABC transporter substrate-binding protein [unclassified Crossiella]|uniref:ABC transporter substrate-binding protein n=1 Tax=unclassified Crossiella TaxID=2620835 RepID=UPI001FFF24FF|nr:MULTISPECIES: ABC transporter substrate-binding protein [unclassified Crossiella]MCK2236402.1 ABC transporter substrate-binding protein [Crossiella sp. S99.2]MCK2250069.1 ABC transporter substrate-binding protein [Crossiella sp. S99.1]